MHNNLLSKLQTDVIYLDFCKAFDSVPHGKLFTKLCLMGITGNLWTWFKSYLGSKFQIVSITGNIFTTLPVTSRVPQRSILGLLLFLVFINDVPALVKSARLVLYADDTECVKSIINHSDCANLQNDLNSLIHWSSSNIVFNKEITVLLRIHVSSHPIAVNYFLDNQELVPTECHCDLGIVISNDLSWSAHYSRIVSKAYRTLGLIHRSFGSSTTVKTRKLLYLSLVRSQLTYCSTIWRPYLLKDIALLESVQRRSTKWILNDYNRTINLD